MPHRSAEDEVAYAFAPPSARQQQWLPPAFSTRNELLMPPKYVHTSQLSSSTTSIHNVTTSEDDDGETGSDSSSSGALISKCTTAKKQNPQTSEARWEASGEELFRHFRKKRVVTATSLQLDVNDLKQEVANLKLLRDILASRVMVRRDDTAGSLMRTARAYYEHFRDGYHPLLSPLSTKRKRSLSEYGQQQVDQAAFLQSILSPTMEAGPLEVGLPLMLEQWRRYSAYFALHEFHMTTADVVITDQVAIVRTKGEFAFHVTRATISGIFPHLLGYGSQPHRRLVDQILGRVFKCPCFVDLYFDAQGQVIRYDEAGDFLGAFSSLLSCPQDLVELFDGALLWEAGVIGSLEPIRIDDATGAYLTAPPAPKLTDASEPQRVRKLYEIDFLLNHEFMDGDAVSNNTHAELAMYEYDDDERTVYSPPGGVR